MLIFNSNGEISSNGRSIHLACAYLMRLAQADGAHIAAANAAQDGVER
ncbi:MAG: hypothetical protein U1E36_05120 [Rickettsiales bacterium]